VKGRASRGIYCGEREGAEWDVAKRKEKKLDASVYKCERKARAEAGY